MIWGPAQSGALPVPVEIVENRTVGYWGETASNAAYAGLGGLVLVLIFMVFYYRLPD